MSKKKLLGIIACIIGVIVVIIATSTEPTPVYTLTTSISPSGAGSVSPSGGEYEPGKQVSLTATPASHYAFNYWSGNVSGTIKTITVIMDSDKSVIANFAITPQPKFTTPGTGAIVGQVMRPDSKPAYGTVVYIFEGEETSSCGHRYVDINGYYIFDGLPPEHYSLYTAQTETVVVFTAPEARVIVSEGVTTVAPTLTQWGHIMVVLPTMDSVTGETIDCTNLRFTWTDVPDASYYVVTIREHRATTEYEETQKVMTNNIAWPTNLSSLPYQDFHMGVEAYTMDDILIARGGERFDCLQS